jgi:hypothetical protein
MPDVQPTTPDAAGVTRTLTGEISNPSITSTPETIVRPPPTPSTTPSSEKKPEVKADAAPDKSLLNEKGPEARAPKEFTEFKTPEGFTLDTEVVKEANTLFKDIDVSQADAQRLVDFYIKHTKEAHEAPFNAWTEKQDDWRNQINSDSELGGSKLNGVKASIGKLLDSLGDTKTAAEFREAMDYTGAGNNPAVVRFLFRMAQKLTEGGPVRGGGPSPESMRSPGVGAPSAAQAIYPNLPSNQR